METRAGGNHVPVGSDKSHEVFFCLSYLFEEPIFLKIEATAVNRRESVQWVQSY